MPSPLDRGEYFARPKPLGTKEEVLAGLFKYLDETLGTHTTTESKEARMERKFRERRSAEIWRANYLASFLPDWVCVGPRKPFGDYTDQRHLNYTGRYGHTRSD
ncbi:TPA: hypothetical protein I8235_003222 [Kluyvera intermedia]|nr:hypothetical protein [Kluyvera intermedia]